MKKTILLLIALCNFMLLNAQTGSITNVVASQRTDGSKVVDINYDLNGQEPTYFILVKISFDGGANYSDVNQLSGDWGTVVPGVGKTIEWDAGNEYPDTEAEDVKIMVYVDNLQNCGEPFTYAGENYETVEIGDQCWMAENLNIGSMIQNTTNQTDNGTIEKYCYNNDTANCSAYGGLYKWDEAMRYTENSGSRGICPAGWHIPTDDEWKTLEGTVDSQYGVGNPEWDQTGWRGYDVATKLRMEGDTCFNALLGGITKENSSFYGINTATNFWTSNGLGTKAYEHGMSTSFPNPINKMFYDSKSMERGYSVRCIKDNSN